MAKVMAKMTLVVDYCDTPDCDNGASGSVNFTETGAIAHLCYDCMVVAAFVVAQLPLVDREDIYFIDWEETAVVV